MRTHKQKLASSRNWNKAIIVGMITNINKMLENDKLYFLEKLRLRAVKSNLISLIRNWDDNTKDILE